MAEMKSKCFSFAKIGVIITYPPSIDTIKLRLRHLLNLLLIEQICVLTLDASGVFVCENEYFKILLGVLGDGYARIRNRRISRSVFVSGRGSEKYVTTAC